MVKLGGTPGFMNTFLAFLRRSRPSYIGRVFLFLATTPALIAGNYFQGVSPSNVPWPGGIVPYLFDTNYPVTAQESNCILAGISEWQLAGNVKFIPYTTQTNHVLIQYTNDGSGDGFFLSGTPATMILHGLERGLLCHEAGHLFGLAHEHQRLDQTNYIVIHPANIIGGSNGEGGLSEFTINSNYVNYSAYDLVSVMHYGVDTFTNGNGDSLDPLPAYEKYYYKLGNVALSLGDRAAISNLYGAELVLLTNVVTNTMDGSAGSLRAAIYYANSHPGTTIKFNIPATDPNYKSNVATISLLGDLPPITAAGTVIDGSTQPGYSGAPVIVIDGAQILPAGGQVSGLHLYGTNCTVRGLACNDFPYAGIQFFCADAASNLVAGCYLGIKPDGIHAAANFLAGAIFQHGAHDNIIGGATLSQRNIISGNTEYGVVVNDTNSDRNVVLGNFIGLNAAGNAPVSNGYSGVGIWGGPKSTLIGGTSSGSGNVISGNGQYGVYISDSITTGVTVQGNYIGTDLTGSNAVPNGVNPTNSYGGIGIFSGAYSNTIGGTTTGARNVISGNTNAGIYLANPGVTENLIAGNYIGLNASGAAALTNQLNGILIFDGASGNTIGGTSVGARNVISGNMQYGVYISDAGTSNNSILGNYIGPDSAGAKSIGDGGFGIGIFSGAAANIIGGSNLISGNPGFAYGIAIGSANSNIVEQNLIGTDATGTNALENGFANVALWGGSTGNLIGGIGAGNVIAFAGEAGVVLYDNATTNNSIRGNSIFSNGYLGINFNNDGVVANDAGDADSGPNDLQNFPIITNAFGLSYSTVIAGTLNSLPGKLFYIDVYGNPTPDSSGYGQGKTYIGTVSLTTDGSGNGKFAVTNSVSNYTGSYFSATATAFTGDTSEFGADVLVTNIPAPSARFGTPLSWRTNGFVFTLTLATNFGYHVQSTTNLDAKPIQWTTVTNFTALTSLLTLTDRLATNSIPHFYRVTSP